MHESLVPVMVSVEAKNPGEPEFHQAVREVLLSLGPAVERNPEYVEAKILDLIVEPERVIMFRVSWVDDYGGVRVNRGFRVQMNSAIGPYKGGLRFHPTVNLGVLKFLAFEQVFKNALTTLPLGGAKGGSDFDPRGRSEGEVRRFCQAFMTELYRHIGHHTDVPAGDMGVGAREIGFLFGQYKRITNEFTGVITGKGVGWGGSYVRPEATGYGLVYFAEEMLTAADQGLDGLTCLVSGSGNVALHTAEKLLDLGARPVTLSDSDGFVHDPDGIDREKLAYVKDLKGLWRGRMSSYVERYPHSSYHPAGSRRRVWEVPADAAFPCATQNEITDSDAAALVRNGVRLVAEGANMPTTPEAVRRLVDSGVLFGPGKAANAGGVAVSGLEMAQDAQLLPWPREVVDARLRDLMATIHATVTRTADSYGRSGDYVFGANVAGFEKVAGAMLAESIV